MTAPKISKPQRFATAADKLDGWNVERIKKPDGARVVRVTRGEEQFTFRWLPNPSGRGEFKFDRGQHKIGDAKEPWANIKAALRIMAEPAGKVRVIEPPKRRGRPPTKTTGAAKIYVERIPFDPASDDDKTILAACAGKKITWRNSLNAEFLENGVCPRGGIHFKITTVPEGLPGEGRRILNFISQDFSGGYRACYVDAIVSVS